MRKLISSQPSENVEPEWALLAMGRTLEGCSFHGIDVNGQEGRIFSYLILLLTRCGGKMESTDAMDPDFAFFTHNGGPIMGSKANDGCAARANAGNGESRA